MVYTRDGDRFLVYASKAGSPTHPDWYLNLVAQPKVVVEVGAERYDAIATPLEGEERDSAFAVQASRVPIFGEYQEKTGGRVIPVVALHARVIKPALLLSSTALAIAPADLLTKLLKTPIKSSELPAGFSKPKLARQTLGSNGVKYHAVGEDAFAWEAFKTHANAVADLDHPALSKSTRIIDTVPGYKESLLLTGSLSGRIVYDAVTVVDNVLVQGVTVSAHGNKAGAIALLRAAVKHLARVRGR